MSSAIRAWVRCGVSASLLLVGLLALAPALAQAAPTITTSASGSIAAGAEVFDFAQLSGLISPQPGSSVTFGLYGPNDADCSGTPAFTSTVALNGGTVAKSAAVTPTA